MNRYETNYRCGKRRSWFVFFPLLFIGFALLLGLVVQQLWNGVITPVFGVGMLGFWQALGLLVLSRILFGGFRGFRGRGGWRNKWKNMNEEDKLRFQEEWKRRCGGPLPGQPDSSNTTAVD